MCALVPGLPLPRQSHCGVSGRGDQLNYLKPLLQAQPLLADRSGRRIRLLVVDSIAAVFRDVGDNPGVRQFAHRSGQLCEVTAASGPGSQRS